MGNGEPKSTKREWETSILEMAIVCFKKKKNYN